MGNLIVKQMDSPEEWEWFNQKTQVPLCSDTIGFVCRDENKIYGVFVMDHFAGKSCQGHIAFEGVRMLETDLPKKACEYLYGRGVTQMFGFVPSDNRLALAFNRRIGGKEECKLEDYFGDGTDYIIFRLSKGVEKQWGLSNGF